MAKIGQTALAATGMVRVMAATAVELTDSTAAALDGPTAAARHRRLGCPYGIPTSASPPLLCH